MPVIPHILASLKLIPARQARGTFNSTHWDVAQGGRHMQRLGRAGRAGEGARRASRR